LEKGLLNPLDVMQECVQLALMGKGYTKTNPCVGAIVAKDNKIISRGWHMAYGEAHAEVNAIDSCPESVEGADIYVTLEPCSHFGKTPPCVEKIVASGIKRVFIGVVDPNPVNAGKGVEYLRQHGVEVFIGYMEELCASIIEDFSKFIYTGMPYFTVKLAQSVDGKIASRTGDSKWITSHSSRAYAHYLRAVSDAVLVGVSTVEQDDPELTVRLIKSDREPYKIVLDPNGRMSLERKLVQNSKDKLIYVTSDRNKNIDKYEKCGIDVLSVPYTENGLDLQYLSKKLIERKILNVMIEGGGKTVGSFFDAGLIDKADFIIAPIVIGGDRVSVCGNGVESVSLAHKLTDVQTRMFEGDMLYSGKVTDFTKPVLELTEKIRGCSSCGCSAHKG